MRRALLAAFTLSIVLCSSYGARASLVFYADRASFDAAVASQTLIDFEGLGDPFAFVPAPPGETLSGVNFDIDRSTSDGVMFEIAASYGYAPTAVLSSQGSSIADDNFLITLPGGFTAIAVDVGGFGADTVTFDLSTGDSFTAISGGYSPSFVGFTSTVAITSLKISQPGGNFGGSLVLNIDNFTFGAAVVPEPSTLALSGVAGLALLAARLRSRRRGN